MDLYEEIKNIRKKKDLTQKEAADICNIPLRTYQNYENIENKKNSLKYEYIVQKLNEYIRQDIENGVYKISEIKEIITPLVSKYKLDFVILIGDYALKKETKDSSINLVINFNKLSQKNLILLEKELNEILYKKTILIDFDELIKNEDLLLETLSKGVRIYE